MVTMASPAFHMQSHVLCPYYFLSPGIKSGFCTVSRTIRSSLISSHLGLSRSTSGSCQLLFIKTQALPRTGPLLICSLPTTTPSLTLFLKMLRVCIYWPSFCVLLYSWLFSTSSKYAFILEAVVPSPGYIRINCYTLKTPATRDPPKQTES